MENEANKMKYFRKYRWALGIAFVMVLVSHVLVFTKVSDVFGSVLFLASITPFGIALLLAATRHDIGPNTKFGCVAGAIYLGTHLLDPLPIGSYFRWFDSESWLKENTWAKATPTHRRLMLGSLYWIKSVGWSEAEIKRNLGQSSEYFQSLPKDGRTMKVYSYRIDNEDGFMGIDSQWLVFSLDKNGLIIKKKIQRD